MQYVVGDRPLLSVTFKEDGSAIDLSPSTNNGVATHRFPASGGGALDEEGVLEFEFYLLDATVSGNAVYTSQKFRRKVRAKVGKTAS